MNSVSWLLYLAEVGDGLRGLLMAGVPGVAVVSLIACGMIGALGAETWYQDTPEQRASKAALRKKMFGYIPRILLGAGVALTLGVFVPSRNTIILIAASQVGETILASDQAKQVGGEAGVMLSDSMKLLHKYIADQLGKDAPKP